MPQCVALNCNNSLGKALYRFPKNKQERKKWETGLKRKNFKASDHHRVCEDHFEEWCFAKNREEARKAGFMKVGLVSGAYPTVFNFNPPNKKNRNSMAVSKRKDLEKIDMTENAGKGTSIGQSLRPRRTERAHRGKPDFYSPSDYENPFKRQRKRTSSAEAEIVKKKGRPRNSLKTLKFESTKQVQKNEDEGSRDNDEGSTDSSKKSVFEEKLSESPIPRKPEREKRQLKPTTKAKIIHTSVHKPSKPLHTAVHKPSKTLNLCSDMSHNKAKEMTLMKDVDTKDKEKEGSKEGKEGASAKHTDLYSSLTAEKSLQYAIILAEINRKFMCQNFKPS